MKTSNCIFLSIMPLLALATLFAVGGSSAAQARNADVEAAIQSSGDLSMFYQALQNTGILDELMPNERYTVFAPTNASWEQISPRAYPCFYAVQCRPQIAALLRNYIVPGEHSLDDLVSYGGGIQTEGAHTIRVARNYPGDYVVEGRKILTQNDIDGNTVYRVEGVIATPADLLPFQTAADGSPNKDSHNMVAETTGIYHHTVQE